MPLEIARRLVGGVWRTGPVEEANGGGGGGGSLPDVTESVPGAALLAEPTPDEDVTEPTVPDLDNTARSAPLIATGWTATYDYAFARQEQVPGATDIVQFLKPTGSANYFAAECSGGSTGEDEPDWDGDAPNPGDSVSDGDLTWYNVAAFASWPPTPTTWQADTEYELPAMVWPSTPNGHVYVVFPPGPLTSDSSEPDFPTDGTFVQDNDGYWWDAGEATVLTSEWVALLFEQLGAAMAEIGVYKEGDGVWAWRPFGVDSALPYLTFQFTGEDNSTAAVRFSNIAIDTWGAGLADRWGADGNGFEYFKHLDPPDDSLFTEAIRRQWFDETTGKPVSRFKQKDAGGTITSGVSVGSTGNQDTVGAAGSAADLPAKPSHYMKVRDVNGDQWVIPMYAVS